MTLATVTHDPWGPYVSYDDVSRFVYGRMLWRHPAMRQRLLTHWMDERHPYRERFLVNRNLVEDLLSTTASETQLDEKLRALGTSLRAAVREIPPVFGNFF